ATRPHVPKATGEAGPTASPESTDHPVVAVVRKLLEKDPNKRYQDASMVIRDLSAAINRPLPVETAATRESFLQAAQFVGRESELADLVSALEAALNGHGSGWLIGGESGVGKSRLLEELRTRALVAGALVLRGQAISEAGMPYLVWREPLRRLSLMTDLADSDAVILQTVALDIGDLLGRSLPPAPDPDPEQARKLLQSVIASIFHRQTQPIVLILEDLHWSGSESRSVLDQISQSVRDLPVLILGSYRDDEVPDLPQALPNMRALTLKRLDEANIAALSESMLGQAGRQTKVLNLLQRETEGNVFFLVEVVRALAEEAGRLDDVGTMTLPAHVFTGGVQRIVERRLGRVPPESYALLQVAAVLGRQLDTAVLRAADSGRNLDQWLAACTDAAVLEVHDERWRFAHDKLREGVLAAIPSDLRAALHRQVALAVESVHPDQIEALAYHWGSAGDAAKEGHYVVLAGDQADRVSAYQEAAAYYRRALTLLENAGAKAATRGQRAALMAKLGRVYSRLNAHADATRLLQECLALAAEIGDRAVMAHVLGCLGNVSQAQGDPASAARYFTDSLNISRETGDRATIVDASRGLARLAEMHGEYDEAARRYEECLTICREIGDRWRIAMTLGRLAVVATSQGDHTTAIQRLEESLAVFRAIGDRRGTASALINLGQAVYNQGSTAEAIRHLEDSLAISREIGDRWSIAATLNNLGYIASLSNDPTQARGHLEESLEIFRESGDQAAVAQTLTNLGHVITALGDDETAAARFREALQIAVTMEAAPVILEIVAGVARLKARAGAAEEAVELAGLALHHPASNSDVKAQAEPLVDSLRKSLAPAIVDAALARGKDRDLDRVAADILSS
ncbi:MAG TPA: tetratricopeptide repeat protein, partial [Aggregatilineales bacterium]|nr:tetratricopeptide repeat protein [Aggregatilineales bacterium]